MDHGTLALLIPIMALSIPFFTIWTKHKRRMVEMELQTTAEKAAQYAVQNRQLEERVRVLERIVTDKGYDVALQIEALRDAHSVEAHTGVRTGARGGASSGDRIGARIESSN